MSEAESGRWGARRESWQRMLANAAAGATVVGVLWTFLGGGSNGPVVPSGGPGTSVTVTTTADSSTTSIVPSTTDPTAEGVEGGVVWSGPVELAAGQGRNLDTNVRDESSGQDADLYAHGSQQPGATSLTVASTQSSALAEAPAADGGTCRSWASWPEIDEAVAVTGVGQAFCLRTSSGQVAGLEVAELKDRGGFPVVVVDVTVWSPLETS